MPLRAQEKPRFEPVGARLGGETTVFASNQNAFTLQAGNLPVDDQRAFFFGNRLFNTNWVIAPSSTKTFDGLGPTFNRVSCSGCHLRDGRGQPPAKPGEEMLSMLVRLSVPGAAADGGPKPHPAYGDQLNDRAIQGIKAEGRAVIAWQEVPGRYGDGETYSLRRPVLSFVDLAYGPLGRDVLVSARVAPAMIGMGLLEAIPDETLLALADPDDRDGDGVSGRVNRVHDVLTGKTAIGRFGWKANAPGVRQQIAAAAIGDIGLTTSIFPQQNCPAAQTACRQAESGGEPEISDEFLDRLELYSQTLAVPARRNVDDPQVRRGEALFSEIGCAACHQPTLQTGTHPTRPYLSNQTIHPFTDLLLHDMGEGLADGRPDFLATGQEWRTPPLWGLGLIRVTNKHEFLLHDGRARGPAEAILWHGGEAEAAKERFRTLPQPDREALVAFLRSL
ncbi:MAG: di-heme oxidoredictase family protein [Reyranellaceae bacterium]